MINSVCLAGNLTRDAELMHNTKTPFMKFGLAVNERKRNENGEWDDVPNFFECVMFGTRAEKLVSWLSKGTKVCVMGRLHQHRWEAEDGSKRQRIEVVVDEFEFMSARKSDEVDW